ncbi:MAG TPA: hypothetical protein VFA15_01405, partial [Nitrososphaera sp.]|nr:hypothetical protein [Nitrososphaera sp.]
MFPLKLLVAAIIFSAAYAGFEYYVVRDTTFGQPPLLFSLLYPYHVAMGTVFVTAAYFMVRMYGKEAYTIRAVLLTVSVVMMMLVIEDASWFTLRGVAPISGDSHAGLSIAGGEWTTRFMG